MSKEEMIDELVMWGLEFYNPLMDEWEVDLKINDISYSL